MRLSRSRERGRGRADDLRIREPAVAGSFYPDRAAELEGLVDECLAGADRLGRRGAAGVLEAGPDVSLPAGVLVPHAGLMYSGAIAAVGWRALGAGRPTVVVLLGTNHSAGWLHGVGAWEAGAWKLPGGAVEVDEALAASIVALGPPFTVDRFAHLAEHSLEVQLPFIHRLLPDARIVPLAVSTGTGREAVEAGLRLGALLAERRAPRERIALAISSDAAHYPPASTAERVNARLAPAIEGVDPEALVGADAAILAEGGPGLACSMCGIEPSVLGLAALRAMGATRGRVLAAGTSADAVGGTSRTVGYMAAVFTA